MCVSGTTANLPVAEPPEVFGLHINAALVRQRGEAKQLLATLAIMQPRRAVLRESTGGDLAVLVQVHRIRTLARGLKRCYAWWPPHLYCQPGA